MSGGGGRSYHRPPLTGVWWDLNTCPLPADFDPLCVSKCIACVLRDQIGYHTRVIIFAIGNLEYISSDLLEKIAYSGIVLIHAPCGGNNLIHFLSEWSENLQQHEPPCPGSGYIMLISGDSSMFDRCSLRDFSIFRKLCAYPKDFGPTLATREKVFVKEFVWETLFSDIELPRPANVSEEDESICMCQVCHVVSETCKDFITHLKSEQHREGLFEIAARDCDGMPRYFCTVCNYPAYDEFNMSLHNESKDHKQKLAESRKRNPQEDLVNEINKKQSLERAPMEEDVVA